MRPIAYRRPLRGWQCADHSGWYESTTPSAWSFMRRWP